jgi:hypothetical protein
MRIPPSFCRPLYLFCLTAAVAACGDGEQSGTLNVTYRFGPGGSCENLGIQDVRVVVGNDVATEEAPCDDDDPTVVVSSVSAGVRDVLVEGLSIVGSDEFRVADNFGNAADDERVEVLGGASKDFAVTLTPTPATLEFIWEVRTPDNGPIPRCQDAAVDSFQVTAYEGASDILSYDFIYCDSAGIDPLPDEERRIKGTDVDGVIVTPIAGSLNFDPIEFVFDPPGPGRTVRMSIRCLGDMCSADGEPQVSGSTPDEAAGGSGDSGG